ncbi:DUF4907 domain-containing protein [Flavobacterium polysaccharolyticum]|uniref:DUF4907 domain-containing protein n=1 Tax=Flavobacterium polysaccharolyticum TaxID=3133148 RepID=A0ABU9NI38_9FLAO
MMTINIVNKNCWQNSQQFLNINQKNNILVLVFAFFMYACSPKNEYQLHTIRVNNGWGYTIKLGGKTIIKQTIIPVISEEKSFVSEKDALKLGTLVVDKLNHDLSPTVTKKDIILLAIKI